MIEIIIGGVVATLGSVVVTFWTRSRELATRWDNDRKIALIDMRLSVERIRGNIYAMAAGAIAVDQARKRPEIVNTNIDRAHYDLETLAMLFPELTDTVRKTQSGLGELLGTAFDSLEHSRTPSAGDEQSLEWYLKTSENLRADLDEWVNADIVAHCQRKLKLS